MIKFAVVIFISSFLLFNVLFSQLISPLYFGVMGENRSSVVTFLKKIKKTPDFTVYLKMNTALFGKPIKDEVYAEEQKRNHDIVKYEELLKKNSKSRDALYNLYLLHNAAGNTTKAREYLKKAKAVDPMIK